MKKPLFEHIGKNLFKLVNEAENIQQPIEQPTPEVPENQGQFYDWTRDFDVFKNTINTTTETAKVKFEKSLGTKIKNRSVLVRSSKGYKQPVKDYTIKRVTGVNVNDFYDDWVVVLKNEFNKEFFLTPGYQIKIIGGAVAPEPGTATAPEQPEVQPKQPEVQPQPQPQQPTTEPKK